MLLLDEGGTAHDLPGEPAAVDHDALARATGWDLKPEGLCKGDVCVPLLGRTVAGPDGRIDLAEWAAALRLPLAVDVDDGVAAIVPAVHPAPAAGGPAPELELPDLDGNPVALSQFRGRKSVLLAWASW